MNKQIAAPAIDDEALIRFDLAQTLDAAGYKTFVGIRAPRDISVAAVVSWEATQAHKHHNPDAGWSVTRTETVMPWKASVIPTKLPPTGTTC